MNPTSSMSLWALFNGGFFPVLILLILFLMSVWSWAIIIQKTLFLKKATKRAEIYYSNLRLKKGIKEVKNRTEAFKDTYLALIFTHAHREFLSKRSQNDDSAPTKEILIRLEREMDKSISSISQRMEKGLSILASISGSAPFIGLFGTVIGIIDAFFNIGAQGAASIAVVAPGISTALVATAFGLFVAIPALIGFNLLRSTNRNIANEMRGFALEILNLFDREITCDSDKSKTALRR